MHNLQMDPAPGNRVLRFVGDRLRFTLRPAADTPGQPLIAAFLRTDLGRGTTLRNEILTARGGEQPRLGLAWRDVPLRPDDDGWSVEFTLVEVGYFKAKAYAINQDGFQVWPAGPDVGISVHPNAYRSANTIYCAFPRLFGPGKEARSLADARKERRLRLLDQQGYAVIPPSGKLRDLIHILPHILDTLGCRILHLLPVNPTPTTYARFGRFGSPYAGLDLTAIDPALIDFDRRTTGVDQFRELAYATHARGARVFLDLVINHTGWSSTLHEQHPEWYLRDEAGHFLSPGAWGVTWEDLVELDDAQRDLWDHLAESFLTWCRRGVDGFRCDAGYKVPTRVWQYLIARVREEFPETLFLLEGLGGAWHDTENLLTEGGMQWAYSELFQEYAGFQVAGYLDHAFKQGRRAGVLVHYSETHDNERLAKKGRAWSLLRNRLSALTSLSGAYGFTCGVEWLADEKIDVHGSTGLAWGAADHLLPELKRLNNLLAEHPCFFDGATLTRLSPPESPVFALRRDSAEGTDHVLVLVNTDAAVAQAVDLPATAWPLPGAAADGPVVDLLGQSPPHPQPQADGQVRFQLPAAGAYCLSDRAKPHGLPGQTYRLARARAAWWIQALRYRLEPEDIGPAPLSKLAERIAQDPQRCLAAADALDPAKARTNLITALEDALARELYARVVTWAPADARRVTLVPPDHWVLVQDTVPFRVTLALPGASRVANAESVPLATGHVACFLPPPLPGLAHLEIERYTENHRHVTAQLRCLAAEPEPSLAVQSGQPPALVLLTNGRGGMARLCTDLGRITSKYDCLLGANLHPRLPVDRHIFAKRVRVWANAKGFISPLNGDNLTRFDAGPPARWRFGAVAGNGHRVDLELTIVMAPDANTTVLSFRQLHAHPSTIPDDVRITVRIDIEDRNFHAETKGNGGAEHHFESHARTFVDRPGFAFEPAPDRSLRVQASCGSYHPAPEWCHNIPHPVEASRGQEACGDAYSPGWFDLPLPTDRAATVIVTAEPAEGAKAEGRTQRAEEGKGKRGEGGGLDRAAAMADCPADVRSAGGVRESSPHQVQTTLDALTARYLEEMLPAETSPAEDPFAARLRLAASDFVVRRDDAKTVIAGYPWFLDWGRDTLICARGLLAAGFVDEVRQLLVAFGRFEDHGTLPNTIHGENASNRDTSDAPLWYGVVAEELAEHLLGSGGGDPRSTIVDAQGRTVLDVLRSIATHYRAGTTNGIRLDPASGLIWSPSHFTWMDTNYPAGTPREGYPIEIQALWIRLLRQLDALRVPADGEAWAQLARRAEASLTERFWLEDRGYFADVLLARAATPAAEATPDTALRPNCLFPIALGLVTGTRAQRCVGAAIRHLLVPGALRSLAPLPVSPPLPISAPDGRLLNNPAEPYIGCYEGDEDTRRKPAYHNGTAWVWTLPTLCEALARAWDFAPTAVAAARSYLGSTDVLLREGCIGHLPEIIDGDAPHLQRGCDAQAWSVTEVLRVWRKLGLRKR